jgi:hypothetical protein
MIHHGDTEARSKLLHEQLTEQVIGAAIEVHRELGPGLMESAYEECLCHELHLRKLRFERQMSRTYSEFQCFGLNPRWNR